MVKDIMIKKRFKDEHGTTVGFEVVSSSGIIERVDLNSVVYALKNSRVNVINAKLLPDNTDFRAKKGYNIETVSKNKVSTGTNNSLGYFYGDGFVDDCIKIRLLARDGSIKVSKGVLSNDHIVNYIVNSYKCGLKNFIIDYLKEVHPYLITGDRAYKDCVYVEFGFGLALKIKIGDVLDVNFIKSSVNRNYSDDRLCCVFVDLFEEDMCVTCLDFCNIGLCTFEAKVLKDNLVLVKYSDLLESVKFNALCFLRIRKLDSSNELLIDRIVECCRMYNLYKDDEYMYGTCTWTVIYLLKNLAKSNYAKLQKEVKSLRPSELTSLVLKFLSDNK